MIMGWGVTMRSVDYVYNRHAWVRKGKKKARCLDCGKERYISVLNQKQREELFRNGRVHVIFCCRCRGRIKEGDPVHSKVQKKSGHSKIQRKGGLVYAKAERGKYSNLYHKKCWERGFIA